MVRCDNLPFLYSIEVLSHARKPREAESLPIPAIWQLSFAHVATITSLDEVKCRITRSSSSPGAARAEAQLHAEQWMDDYFERGSKPERPAVA
jgi:hypothetical protein